MKYLKTYIIIGILTILGSGLTMAETVSQKQAQQLAHLFFNQAAGRVTAPPKLIYNGKRLTTDRLFTPFYVYNTSLGGFVIISAENKAYPILGFSLKDSFDPEKIGETERQLLKSYAHEIEMVRYDSDPVDQTFKAWQNYPAYVNDILSARYDATDPKISIQEAYTMVDNAMDDDDAIYADIYTPEQWRSMIEDELQSKESVAVAVVDNHKLYPMVLYGRQGEYFRIEMSKRNSWLMRLNATDIIPTNMVGTVGNVPFNENNIVEETPFETFDAFLEEVNENEIRRSETSSIDILYDDGMTPLVKSNGGGHFEVVLPENATLAMIYNLSGSMVRKVQFAPSQLAHIDLSPEPYGFYIVTVIGESGTPYGIKLYR